MLVGLGFPLLLVAWHLQQLCATAAKARYKRTTGLLWWHTLQCQVPSQSRRSSFDVEIATSIMASPSLATRRKGMSTIRLLDQQKRQMISTDWLWATLPHLGKLKVVNMWSQSHYWHFACSQPSCMGFVCWILWGVQWGSTEPWPLEAWSSWTVATAIWKGVDSSSEWWWVSACF